MKKVILSLVLLLNIGFGVYAYDVAITKDNLTQPTELEAAIIAQVNAYRADLGLLTQEIQPNLVEAARNYAKTLAEQGRFAHEDPITPHNYKPVHRIYKTGVFARGWVYENLILDGDNSFEGKSIQQIAVKSVEVWHKSPGHRMAMRNEETTHTGVGVYTLHGKTYVCQIFANLPYIIKNVEVNEHDGLITIKGIIHMYDHNYEKKLTFLNGHNKKIGDLDISKDDNPFILTYKKNTGRQTVIMQDSQQYSKAFFIDTTASEDKVISTVRLERDTEDGTWDKEQSEMPTPPTTTTQQVSVKTSVFGL